MSTHTSRRSPRAILTIAGLVALVGSVAMAAPATAGPGEITGTVSGPSPMSTIRVRVIGVNDTKPAPVSVDDTGHYTVPWATTECGWVEAFSTDGYWTTDRTPDPVCEGDTAPALSLSPAGAISGTASAGSGTTALSVLAFDANYDIAAQAPVADNGTYLLGGLPAGSYRIAFDHRGPDHQSLDTIWSTTNAVRYYSSGSATGLPEMQYGSATQVPVAVNQTTSGVDVAMQAGGAVSGTLTCLGGQPAAKVAALAVPFYDWPLTARLGYHDPATNGAFSVTGLSPDVDYVSQVWGCGDLAVYTGNTLHPYKAEAFAGDAAPVHQLDLRTARLFADVAASTLFVADMQWLVTAGIANGYSDDTFRPVTAVRRDAMAAFLFRMDPNAVDYVPPTVSPFADITPQTSFYKEMCWLWSEGISTGWVSGGKRYYKPLQPVARDAMAAFLYRFAYQPTFTEVYAFADVTPATTFHKEMNWMYDASISTGWVSGGQRYYKPLSSVNRDAMAAFLHRLDSWFVSQAAPFSATAAPKAGAGTDTPSRLTTTDGPAGDVLNTYDGRLATPHRTKIG